VLLVVIQATPLDALQLQPATAVTPTLLVPPTYPMEPVVDASEYTHGAPVWVNVNTFPAMVRVPLRDRLEGLAATTYDAVPFPVPVLLAVIQATPLDALQLQPSTAVTPTLLVPPAYPIEPVEDASEYTQGAPVCVTVKTFPAMVNVPLRDRLEGLAATT
jgi:hypothetical protein